MLPKCSNCGLDHLSESCKSPIQKCANCKGDHQAVSLTCTKRKEFMEMRNRLASSNNKKPKKPAHNKFKPEEIGPIMTELLSGLKISK